MNLLGKLFTIANLVFTVCLMAGAAAIYATHHNWRAEIERTDPSNPGWKQRLTMVYEENVRLTKERDEKVAELNNEIAAKRQALAKLESEVDQHVKELAAERAKYQQAAAEARAAAEALTTSQTNLAKIEAELGTLRGDVRAAQKDRDDKFQQVVTLTEKVNQANGDLSRLNERSQQLAGQVAYARSLLAKFNATLETPLDLTPMPVDGVVLASNGDKLIEISLGSYDSLREGHTLHIVREGKFIGTAQVVKTEPNRSVCTVDPKTITAPIQKGDRVTTRIKS